jgi:Domain of unknown function (DUF932)
MNYTQAIGTQELQRRVPSAFATRPWDGMSDRYAFIPTSRVIEGMAEAGFVPVNAIQSRTRVAGKQDYTKHMIRFRSLSTLSQQAVVGNHVVELVMVNGHDGSTAYDFFGGVFRFWCSNGATVSESTLASIKVRHTGNVVEEAIRATQAMFEQAPRILDVIGKWEGITLSVPEQLAFAEAAHELRFPRDAENNAHTLVTPQHLLTAHRSADRKDDLWTTFNRVQENTTKKVRYGRDRATGDVISNRAVKGIDGDVKLNRALWTLAEKMAELKGGN